VKYLHSFNVSSTLTDATELPSVDMCFPIYCIFVFVKSII